MSIVPQPWAKLSRKLNEEFLSVERASSELGHLRVFRDEFRINVWHFITVDNTNVSQNYVRKIPFSGQILFPADFPESAPRIYVCGSQQIELANVHSGAVCFARLGNSTGNRRIQSAEIEVADIDVVTNLSATLKLVHRNEWRNTVSMVDILRDLKRSFLESLSEEVIYLMIRKKNHQRNCSFASFLYPNIVRYCYVTLVDTWRNEMLPVDMRQYAKEMFLMYFPYHLTSLKALGESTVMDNFMLSTIRDTMFELTMALHQLANN